MGNPALFPTILKKITTVIAASIICGVFLLLKINPSFAQATDNNYYNQTYFNSNYYSNINYDVPYNDHTRTQIVLIELSSAILCQLVGIDVMTPEKGCLGIDLKTQKIGYMPQSSVKSQQPNGLLGMVINMTAALYNKPISSIDQIKYYAQRFGFSNQAYAQSDPDKVGTGFNTLSSMMDIWMTFRNITYFGMIVIFVLIGFGIMLRIKLDAKTVMTIQNQVPKIIIGLLLITFSYSIAGFIIDSMWVLTYASINVLAPKSSCKEPTKPSLSAVATGNLLNNPISYASDILGDETGCFGSFDGIGGLSKDVGNAMAGIITDATLTAIGIDQESAPDCGWFPTSWDDCAEKLLWAFIYFIISVIALIIVWAAILIALFRVWIMALKAFVYLIMGTISSPFWIIAGFKPNSSLGFGRWIRFMAAHALVFPTIAVMFILAHIFALNNPLNNPHIGFAPPFIGNPKAMQGTGSLIAFGIILVIPQVLTMLRDALNTKPNPYVTPAIIGGTVAGLAASRRTVGVGLRPLLRPMNPNIPDDEGGRLRGWLRGDPNSPRRFPRIRGRTIGRIMRP